jgi:hypothetical protein
MKVVPDSTVVYHIAQHNTNFSSTAVSTSSVSRLFFRTNKIEKRKKAQVRVNRIKVIAIIVPNLNNTFPVFFA